MNEEEMRELRRRAQQLERLKQLLLELGCQYCNTLVRQALEEE